MATPEYYNFHHGCMFDVEQCHGQLSGGIQRQIASLLVRPGRFHYVFIGTKRQRWSWATV